MPDPATLDVRLYLVPISDENPAGECLRYEEEYAQIERSREEEDEVDSSDRWKKPNPKKADWDAVISLGLKLLKEKTKDLEIASLVADALSRRRGLVGVRDGLRLVREIQDAFWDTAYPEDIETREGVYEFLDDGKIFPLIIQKIPIVGVNSYSFLDYGISREIKNRRLEDSDKAREILELWEAEGKVKPEDFDKAVEATDREFYVALANLLGECLDAANQLNLSNQTPGRYDTPQGKKKPRKPPTLSKTLTALEEVSNLVNQFLRKKPAAEPIEAIDPVPDPTPDWSSEIDSSEPAPVVTAVRPTRPSPSPIRGSISGPDEARGLIAAAARHLREADPSDPIPYLVVRSLRMGELYRSSGSIDPSSLRPPSSDDRQVLRRLANEGSWPELLEHAEQILARPEGTGWLDVRRLAVKAVVELGLDNVDRATKAILAAELRDYPDWPRSELDDGTPCASTETLAWLEETFPTKTEPESEESTSVQAYRPSSTEPSVTSGETNGDGVHTPDAWEQAQDYHQQGRSQEAVSLLGRAAREARTGRERFLRTFQQAELCMMMGRSNVATPLLEGLSRQIDEFQLDRWEDPALCARVLAALYQCLRGKDEIRARSIYDRLCQLDITQALNFRDGGDA